MAKRYLGVVATSVPSEQLFSTAGNVVTAKRSALDPKNVEKLVFLCENLLPLQELPYKQANWHYFIQVKFFIAYAVLSLQTILYITTIKIFWELSVPVCIRLNCSTVHVHKNPVSWLAASYCLPVNQF